MPIPASGPISSTDLQTEFGGQNPINLGDYYAGGIYVGAGTTGTNGPVPASGPISLSDFYGTSRLTTTVNYIATQFTVGQYITSADGITWTARNWPDSTAWLWVARGDNNWVVLPSSGSTALYSSDGINWTSTSLPISAEWSTVGFTNGRFVAAAFVANTGGTQAIYSDNGVSWTASSLPFGYWSRTSGGNGAYIVSTGINSSNAVGRSLDGINWTAPTIPGTVIFWGNAAYGDDVWVMTSFYDSVGNGTTLNARSTDNGLSWSLGGAYPSTGNWYSIAYTQTRFVSVKLRQNAFGGDSSEAAYSSDGGLTWSASTMPASRQWVGTSYAKPFSNVVSIGLGTNSGAYSSNGGLTWTATTLPISGNWNGIAAK
jgi:hypothetical protein